MTAYTVLKFLHVLLAIAAVGSNLTYGVWLGRAARDRAHLDYVLRGVRLIDNRIANPAYGLLLVTGVAMVYVGRLPWETPWLAASIGLYVLVILIGALGYTPALRRQIAALQAAGPDAESYQRIARRAQNLGIVLGVLVVLIVFLMVTKPGLWSA